MGTSQDASFSLVQSTIERTLRLPGGEVRGLSSGRVISGLSGLGAFSNDLNEAARDYRDGRYLEALRRVKRIQIRFNASADHWGASIADQLREVRYGKDVRHLEQLRSLKSAEVSMGQLILPARKALVDLIAAISIASDSEGRSEA